MANGEGGNQQGTNDLQTTARQWPTPMAGTPAQNGNSAAGNSDFSRGVMALWSTPKGSDGPKGGPSQAYGSGGTPPLPAQAATWPTPAAQNVKGSSVGSLTRADGKSRMDILQYRAEQGFTHQVPTTPEVEPESLLHAPISRPLWASMIVSHGPSVSRRILKARKRRRLNPLFVGWLMGWPLGHALCGCSAMEFTRWQQRMRGALSLLPMVSGPWLWEPTTRPAAPAQIEMFGGSAS